MRLRKIAHARSGDKGDIVNIAVIAYKAQDYGLIRDQMTVDRVRAHFRGMVMGNIERYELPQLLALNFVMHGALDGGVTKSLRLDPHGKCLSSYILDMEIRPEHRATE